MSTTKPLCLNCKFSALKYRDMFGYRACRFDPPKALQSAYTDGSATVWQGWPAVSDDDFCSKFEAEKQAS
ncbi:MAG: hypothetical protein WBX25_06225 [Rhodomicrobium sp.]